MDNKADLKIYTDTANDNTVKSTLEAIGNGTLTKEDSKQIAKNYFLRGHYQYAEKLYKTSMNFNGNVIDDFVNAIELGIAKSVENNKYQALINLTQKAGIKIPDQFAHLIHNTNDQLDAEEFNFVHGLLHKLAFYYIGLSKHELENSLASCDLANLNGLLSHAFAAETSDRLADFSKAKEFCSQSKELSKIETEFDAYYQVLGKSFNMLDNDYALEISTINGLLPPPLEESITVFRGIKANVDSQDINSWFKYGIRASSMQYQKFLGYYVNQPWNEVEGMWNLGGTYVSLEPHKASEYSFGKTSSKKTEAVLLEIQLPKGSPKICGPYACEYELIPSTVDGMNLIAVYKLNETDQGPQVIDSIKNPYLASNTPHKYNCGDYITVDKDAIATYNKLECGALAVSSNHWGDIEFHLYENYKNFSSCYTADLHAKDQRALFDNYFIQRPDYDYLYDQSEGYFEQPALPHSDCNLELYCC